MADTPEKKKKKVQRPQEPCIKCEERLTRHSSRMCTLCQKLYPGDVVDWRVPFGERLRSYMKRREQGWTQREIAAEWGVTLKSVKLVVAKARSLGVHIAAGQINKVTEHGGGKSGIAHCTCDPCRNKRLQYMRDQSKSKRERERAKKTAK